MKQPLCLISLLASLTIVLVTLSHFSLPSVSYRRELLGSLFASKHGVTHNELFSLSTTDREYFMISFGDQQAMNPNIIPHPFLDETWIVVAQLRQEGLLFAEIACNAQFENGTLVCINHANALPIASTYGDKCTGDLEYIGHNRGPHDARVFYGPASPYVIYGSNSMFACFGQWMQDFQTLYEWGFEQIEGDDYVQGTELQRPPPYGVMEKNWFLFFDLDDHAYLHYDVSPQRSFAKLGPSGTVGPDLGALTAASDAGCMVKYMPKLGPQLESIHQATPSLSFTNCKRGECVPDSSNTYIFTIFQHKTYFNFHALYEPYVMVFEQTSPFHLHGISKRPFWIHGRKGNVRLARIEDQPGALEEEMLYITSMSWKSNAQKYHGFLDDEIFVTFGIEDEQTAAIDVVAADLLQDLGTC